MPPPGKLNKESLKKATYTGKQAPWMPTRSDPVHQLQTEAGNQATIQMMQDGGQGGNSGGWFSNMFNSMLPNFPSSFGDPKMKQYVRAGVAAGFENDSVDIYDMWQYRKDPEKLDQFMRSRLD
ncbi:hypothetical protein [Cohnella herbarum]|uniref:Uncharacterized protein n=1 Tax=Cohnella herbarum TaxID=2728023 RepID=A0A7Z2VJZ2_9BACL|nr:hypothetical protein [Cohnella herbarum]QJD84626.1 hypothetical protein HH215_16520 [Cohnella herbarum]